MPTPRLPRVLTALALVLTLLVGGNVNAEGFFRNNDVVAFVGGEDMVAAVESGYLELALTVAYPQLNLKFRSFAWEGDTVYEQRRDLNYPTLEQQLDKVGATVVICQFGTMESFDGTGKVNDFVTAYKALLGKLTANGKRRAIILTPWGTDEPIAPSPSIPWRTAPAPGAPVPLRAAYAAAINAMYDGESAANQVMIVEVGDPKRNDTNLTRDGVHLSAAAHRFAALTFASDKKLPSPTLQIQSSPTSEKLRQIIIEKNRLWFNYYRPQNWAFLAGDRTNQPSSRDHLDPTKRWFPEELEQFLPLIARRETEISALANDLAKP